MPNPPDPQDAAAARGAAAEAVARRLAQALGGRWALRPLGVSGFCSTWQARAATGARLFVKSLPAARADMLAAEADGLQALAAVGAITVPQVAACCTGTGTGTGRDDHDDGPAVLAMDWLDIVPPDQGHGRRLGEALGALHAAAPRTPRPCFGWPRDNRLGSTVQRQGLTEGAGLGDWLGFIAGQRLGALSSQLDARHAALAARVDAVIAALPALHDDGHRPRPALIHGDLWSGNHGMLADGRPAVWDPAVSWSDAEAELAMLELFGSPPAGFWPAYRATAGLHAGYPRRRPVHQLYHLLNHVLLFGHGYVGSAMQAAQAALDAA